MSAEAICWNVATALGPQIRDHGEGYVSTVDLPEISARLPVAEVYANVPD